MEDQVMQFEVRVYWALLGHGLKQLDVGVEDVKVFFLLTFDEQERSEHCEFYGFFQLFYQH